MTTPRTVEVTATVEQVDFVIRHLRHYPTMNRFDLMRIHGSPLGRKMAFYVLRDMEERGLIKSRLPKGTSIQRLYLLPE